MPLKPLFFHQLFEAALMWGLGLFQHKDVNQHYAIWRVQTLVWAFVVKCLCYPGDPYKCSMEEILRVSDRNGVSLLYIMLEIHILVGNPRYILVSSASSRRINIYRWLPLFGDHDVCWETKREKDLLARLLFLCGLGFVVAAFGGKGGGGVCIKKVIFQSDLPALWGTFRYLMSGLQAEM